MQNIRPTDPFPALISSYPSPRAGLRAIAYSELEGAGGGGVYWYQRVSQRHFSRVTSVPPARIAAYLAAGGWFAISFDLIGIN